MKSFCIKNNNENILNYLLNELENIEIEDVYFSKNQFKNYKNIIVHYKGRNCDLFIMLLSKLLTNCVLQYYEEKCIRRIINSDYFYFTSMDKEYIFMNCKNCLHEYEERKDKIALNFYQYIKEHKFFILDGFVNFRLFEYKSMLEDIVDIGVNKYIIDKEYKEVIQLLQNYINSKQQIQETVHVIYSDLEPILLDEKENIIVYDKNIMQSKYLSDISFSSKDYCLNELLNLLPKRIILHLLVEDDEFTKMLQLVFSGRIIVCKECSICKTFKFLDTLEKKN